MSFVPRLPTVRRGAILGSAALVLGLVGAPGANAQCVDTTGFGQASSFLPLGQGGALSAIVSSINAANTAFLTSTSAFVSAPGGPRPDQQGGGAWGRVIGGTVTNENTGVTTPTTPILQLPIGGNVTCNTKTETQFSGFQVGHDISILNGGGTGENWHWGVTAGYFEADSKDKTFGTFSGNFQVPFAGVYTAFTKGNLALDAQVRWDFYNNTLTDATNGLFGQTFDGHGFSVTANAAYNIPLPKNWFIEPSIGMIWSTANFDPLNVSGTLVLLNSPFIGAPGTVQIQEIESLLGRISLSTGTMFQSGGVTWQPFFTASLFHEFMGDVTTDISTSFVSLGGGVFTGADDGTAVSKTSRVGTYAQFALGTAAVLGNTGWLGYGRVDYRTGENIDGWSVNAGLRYQFTPEVARGSIKDGPAVAAWDSYNWTGPYLGGFAGRVWGTEAWEFTGGATVDPEFAGYIGGGQIGYNIQLGRVVVGVEGDYGFTNANGGKSCPTAIFFTCEAEADRLASVTGRLGYTWGRALFYAKGGWAGGEVTAATFLNTGGNPTSLLFTPTLSSTKWANGWTIGGGMEFALTDRWSAKAEYMHFDLGTERHVTFVTDPGTDVGVDGDIVRIGVNYHLHAPREARPLK
jgi:opacity protein-like surface antigen